MGLKVIGGLVAAALLAVPAASQELPDWVKRTTLSGLAFGDAYYVARHHDAGVERQRSGFWVRRAYFTVDNALGDGLSYRFRLEVNSPGDFKTSAALVPYVKDLWVGWQRAGHRIVLGLSPSPTWEVVERIWGYRSVEKTPLDLQKLGDSRDFGVAALGRLDGKGTVRYHAMLANGAGTKSEADAGKKAMLSLGLFPDGQLVLELYGDYEGRPGGADRATLQVFGAWRGSWGRVGVQAARQWQKVPAGPDLALEVASGFAVARISDRVSLLGRYDRMFDANPEGERIAYLAMSPAAKTNLVLGGVDVALRQGFHLIPNLEAVLYSDAGAGRPPADVFVRVTFDVIF